MEQKERVAGKLRDFLQRIGLGAGGSPASSVLPPKGICPICATANLTALNGLSDLFEELGRQTEDVQEVYFSSGGICLEHLRQGI